MTGAWHHNMTTSCTVCGHIHAHAHRARVDLVAHTCSDCGVCTARRFPEETTTVSTRTVTREDRRLLVDERRALLDRLAAVGSDPTMGVLERSAERTALRARIADIADELED